MVNVYIFWFHRRTCKSICGLTLPIYLHTVLSYFWAVTSIINVGGFRWELRSVTLMNDTCTKRKCGGLRLSLVSSRHMTRSWRFFVCVFGGFSALSTLTTSSILLEQLYGNGKKGNCWGCTEHVLKLVHFYCYLSLRGKEKVAWYRLLSFGVVLCSCVRGVCCVWEYR